MNGEHTISAELQIAGGMMADGMHGPRDHLVEYRADRGHSTIKDGYVVTADLGHNSALDE